MSYKQRSLTRARALDEFLASPDRSDAGDPTMVTTIAELLHKGVVKACQDNQRKEAFHGVLGKSNTVIKICMAYCRTKSKERLQCPHVECPLFRTYGQLLR